jgi:hypothetical protein
MENHGGMALAREPKDSEKSLSQCRFAHYKYHNEWPGPEPGSPL